MNNFWLKRKRPLKLLRLCNRKQSCVILDFNNHIIDEEIHPDLSDSNEDDTKFLIDTDNHDADDSDNCNDYIINEDIPLDLNDANDDDNDLFNDTENRRDITDSDNTYSSDENDSDFVPDSKALETESSSSSSDADSSIEKEKYLSPKQKRQKYLQQQVTIMSKRISVLDAKNDIFQQLVENGYMDYFSGGLLVDLSDSMLQTLKYRVLDFLYFLYLSNEPADGHVDVVDLMTAFITTNMGQMSEYCKQLSELQNLTPYTVRNYVDHLLKFIEWFILYRRQTDSRKSAVTPSKYFNAVF